MLRFAVQPPTWNTRSMKRVRTLRPRRLLLFCQKLTSLLNARNSKSRCSTDASSVTVSRYL